ADLGGNELGKAASELDRAGILLVFPFRGILRLAADPEERAAAAAANVGFLPHERGVELRSVARSDLDHFHRFPQPFDSGRANIDKTRCIDSRTVGPSPQPHAPAPVW